MDCMESLLHVLSQRLGALGWAVLLPVVMLVCTVYWGVRPWTLTMLFVAGAITLLVPAVAADLLALALIGLGANAFALAKRGDPLPQGSGTTANYPLHTLVFGGGGPRTLDMTLGVVMVAFGAWLVPRTIGAHSGLAKRNGELMSRAGKGPGASRCCRGPVATAPRPGRGQGLRDNHTQVPSTTAGGLLRSDLPCIRLGRVCVPLPQISRANHNYGVQSKLPDVLANARRVRLPQMLVGLTRMKCAGTPSTHGSSPASMNGARSASVSR